MSYVVLARKWRPQSFEDLVGQEHVSTTLANAIARDRVAHAFLFTGVRGVGKTTSARILAKALNCAQGPTAVPCQTCPQCTEITVGADVDVQEIDGASYNGVDEVRRLQESLPYRPSRDRFKIFIVDEVHMLSNAAWNAFLKTLEEPPPHVKFIFATTEVHKVPVTILSRCQRYDFKLITAQAIAARLRWVLGQENIPADDAALTALAREAAGSMRDAMSLLDQVIAWVGTSGERITSEGVAKVLGVADRVVLHRLAEALVDGDPAVALRIVGELAREGYDLPHVARDFLAHLRDLVVAKVCEDPGPLLDLADAEVADVKALAGKADADDLTRLHQGFSRAFDDIVRGGQPRASLEMALVRLARRPPLLPIDELLRRLGDLERRIHGGGGGAPSGGGQERGPQRPGAPPPQQQQAPQRRGAAPARADEPRPVEAAPAGATRGGAPAMTMETTAARVDPGPAPAPQAGSANGAASQLASNGAVASAMNGAAAISMASGAVASATNGVAATSSPSGVAASAMNGAAATSSLNDDAPMSRSNGVSAASATNGVSAMNATNGAATTSNPNSVAATSNPNSVAAMNRTNGAATPSPVNGTAAAIHTNGAAVSGPVNGASVPVRRPSDPAPATRSAPPPGPTEASGRTANERSSSPPAPPVSAELGAWRAVLALIQRQRPALTSVLEHAALLELTPTRAVLGYEANSFLVGQATEPAARELLAGALRAHFGGPTEVVFETIARGAGAPSLAQVESAERKVRVEAARRAVAEHPLVTAAIELLGAELKDVRLGQDAAEA